MKAKRSTVLPLILLAYLCVMAYIGRGEFLNGNYLYYFGIIGLTLCAIVALHFVLKRRERNHNVRKPQ